ncbi:hypothetical protein KBX50_26175 [Micromonospora sp. C51]|uniref:hypothetical protein n=1 Tax=Micromonospora sp. C51 TaxID=2824879 RepID=UPI001B3593C1|nr:hypothetical protein [Micromonospora sp. C51]MBQ1051934.1 hypothetical protein [Micromonospora sp. C51]
MFSVFSGIAIPAANAASFKYADDIDTAEGRPRYSGLRSTIAGGKVAATVGVGTSTIISYYDYPGYDEVGYASGPNPYVVTLTHQSYSTLQSKCYWEASGVGGSTEINCWVLW